MKRLDSTVSTDPTGSLAIILIGILVFILLGCFLAGCEVSGKLYYPTRTLEPRSSQWDAPAQQHNTDTPASSNGSLIGAPSGN